MKFSRSNMRLNAMFSIASLSLLAPCLHTNSIDIEKQQMVTSISSSDYSASVHHPNPLSSDRLKNRDDLYLTGYIQALLDMHYYEMQVIASSSNHEVTLFHLPNNQALSNSIVQFIQEVPGVNTVLVGDREILRAKDEYGKIVHTSSKELAKKDSTDWIWAPQATVLFDPFVASPRKICCSAGYRAGDKVISKGTTAVSLGDEWPIVRWQNVGPYYGDVQLGLDAGIWTVFDMKNKKKGDWADLINADYYVGIPLTYAYDQWSYRLRLYHISSHVGDEAIESGRVKKEERLNPSMEAIDAFASYRVNDYWRLYGGLGYILHSDKSYKLKHLYTEYGAELRLADKTIWNNKFALQPYLGVHVTQLQDNRWQPSVTTVLGYEWSKIQGVGKKLRTYLEYHKGYSLEGQFSRRKTAYVSLNIAYGF